MRVLLADRLPDAAVARLEAAGNEVIIDAELTEDDLGSALTDVDVLVVRSTRVTADALDASRALGLIVRAGAGTNTIDTARAAELGVFVCNVPGRNALAVAELTIGLLLAVDRHIAEATADLRAGHWKKNEYSKAAGLYGRRLGIVGVGDIGIAVAERATGFGMEVVAEAKPGRSADKVERAEDAGITFLDDLDTVLATSDIVTIHVPGAADTRHLVDAAFLARMRDGAILLNTSRGDVVDEAALIEAMDTRGLRAGLDVFADEPGTGTGTFDSVLARHPGVVATHHIGASTQQSQEAVAEGTVDVIEAYRRGEIVHCVNLEDDPARATTLSIRHYDRVGVLAAILAILRGDGINVSNMRNQIFAGAKAAVATIDVGSVPPEAALEQIAAHDDVIHVTVLGPSPT